MNSGERPRYHTKPNRRGLPTRADVARISEKVTDLYPILTPKVVGLLLGDLSNARVHAVLEGLLENDVLIGEVSWTGAKIDRYYPELNPLVEELLHGEINHNTAEVLGNMLLHGDNIVDYLDNFPNGCNEVSLDNTEIAV